MMAIWRSGRPKELLHHSDQGSQYTSEPFLKTQSNLGPRTAQRRANKTLQITSNTPSILRLSAAVHCDASQDGRTALTYNNTQVVYVQLQDLLVDVGGSPEKLFVSPTRTLVLLQRKSTSSRIAVIETRRGECLELAYFDHVKADAICVERIAR